MSLKILFGRKLQKVRGESGLSQEKLAEAIGVQVRYINYLEHGKRWPSDKTVEGLARELKVEVWELFDFRDLG